jgi:hypothetical protein
MGKASLRLVARRQFVHHEHKVGMMKKQGPSRLMPQTSRVRDVQHCQSRLHRLGFACMKKRLYSSVSTCLSQSNYLDMQHIR